MTHITNKPGLGNRVGAVGAVPNIPGDALAGPRCHPLGAQPLRVFGQAGIDYRMPRKDEASLWQGYEEWLAERERG